MPDPHVIDIKQFLTAAGELVAKPVAVNKTGHFLAQIIEAATRNYPALNRELGVHCRKQACTGTLRASLPAAGAEIAWFCPSCLQKGVIRNWQGTKWDRTASSAAEPGPAARYTPKEGQYLAFIYYYTKLNGRPPAELDMQVYFHVTPPTVHDMVVKLEKRGFITRQPGVARSIRLLLKREELPDLE